MCRRSAAAVCFRRGAPVRVAAARHGRRLAASRHTRERTEGTRPRARARCTTTRVPRHDTTTVVAGGGGSHQPLPSRPRLQGVAEASPAYAHFLNAAPHQRRAACSTTLRRCDDQRSAGSGRQATLVSSGGERRLGGYGVLYAARGCGRHRLFAARTARRDKGIIRSSHVIRWGRYCGWGARAVAAAAPGVYAARRTQGRLRGAVWAGARSRVELRSYGCCCWCRRNLCIGDGGAWRRQLLVAQRG